MSRGIFQASGIRRRQLSKSRTQPRNSDDELRALIGARAGDLDPPIMHFHELADESQPYAQPSLGAVERMFDLREGVKNFLQHRRRNGNSVGDNK